MSTYRSPLIALAAAVVAAVAFYFLLYAPRNDDLAAVVAETGDLESQRAMLDTELRRLRDIQAREPEYRAALARLEELVPSGPAQPTVVRQFQQAADDAGVTIASVSFSEPTPVVGAPPSGEPGMVLGAMTVTMDVHGGYFQVVDLLRRLELEVPRAILMRSLTMGEETEAGLPTLVSTWSGELFALVPAPADAVPAAPPADAAGGEQSTTEPAGEQSSGAEPAGSSS